MLVKQDCDALTKYFSFIHSNPKNHGRFGHPNNGCSVIDFPCDYVFIDLLLVVGPRVWLMNQRLKFNSFSLKQHNLQ